MIVEICHLEGRHFPLAVDAHRYFCHMGNRAHRAWLSICEVNLPWVFCLEHLDPVFVADFFVDEVFCCSRVNHSIDSD